MGPALTEQALPPVGESPKTLIVPSPSPGGIPTGLVGTAYDPNDGPQRIDSGLAEIGEAAPAIQRAAPPTVAPPPKKLRMTINFGAKPKR